MIAEDYLLITEIAGDGQHKVPLAKLRHMPITVGRAQESESHIHIGTTANTKNWISSYQCTLLAQRNTDSPRGWDYYVHDGHMVDGEWRLSKQGIWVGHRAVTGLLELRPGLAGSITIFPKIDNDLVQSKYHCILEWPAQKEPGDDTDPPTLQQFQAVQMERRIFKAEAAQAKKQLETLARNMGSMQVQFTQEREELSQKINDQSGLLLRLSGNLEQERQVNEKQELQLAEQKKRNKRVKISIASLGLIVLAIAAFAINIDQETMKDLLEWSLLIVGGIAAIFGVQSEL